VKQITDLFHKNTVYRAMITPVPLSVKKKVASARGQACAEHPLVDTLPGKRQNIVTNLTFAKEKGIEPAKKPAYRDVL
jgi:hypothetical protein